MRWILRWPKLFDGWAVFGFQDPERDYARGNGNGFGDCGARGDGQGWGDTQGGGTGMGSGRFTGNGWGDGDMLGDGWV